MLNSSLSKHLCLNNLSRAPKSVQLHGGKISVSQSRNMATVKDSIPHVIRTAHEPRQRGLWNATLSRIDQVNSNIRLLRLSLGRDGNISKQQPLLRHLPGQYIDLQIPSITTVGGFTITSPPQTALPQTQGSEQDQEPYIELAIQSSPTNPPAAYLWLPPSNILHAPVSFRVGGTFVYPPLTLKKAECEVVDSVVFVAGGVGVNPIMSMVSAMDRIGSPKQLPAASAGGMTKRIRLLYSARRQSTNNDEEGAEHAKILFEDRLRAIAEKWRESKEVDYRYTFFETSGVEGQNGDDDEDKEDQDKKVRRKYRRIRHSDLFEALGPVENRANTLVYICGLPDMTDEFVDLLKAAEGMDERRVLCEKWW